MGKLSLGGWIMKVLQFFFCYLHLCFLNKMNTNCFYNKKNKAGKENGGPEGPVHSLCLNLALPSFSCSHDELFMCWSPPRADSSFSSVALPTPAECTRHTSGCSRVVAGLQRRGWVPETPHVPSVQAHKRMCIFLGVRAPGPAGVTLPVGASGLPLWEAGCELSGSY